MMLLNVEEFDNIQPGRFIIWILKACGLWNFEGKSWNSIYRLYGWMLHLTFTFLFILGMYINVGMAQNLNDLSDAIYISLTETALIVKVLNAQGKCKTAVRFLETFDKYEDGKPRTQREIDIAKKAHVSFNRLRNPYIGGSWVALLFSLISPFLNASPYILPFPCWIPFDYRNSRNYIFAYAYVAIGISVTATTNCTLDAFQSYLLLQLSIYNKILKERFENFGHKNNRDETTLNKYIHFHSFVRSLTSECERFISSPLMVQMVLSSFVICFAVFKLQKLSFIENPSTCLMLIVFGVVMALQIYLPCLYGHELTTSFDDLTNAVYASNWTDMSPETRRKIFIFMELLKPPVVITAGKLFHIGLGLFLQIMNNTYRVYAVLLNIET